MLSEDQKMLNFENKNQREWTLPFSSICLNNEGVFELNEAPPPSSHVFWYDGKRVNVSLETNADHAMCRMWSEICLLPYTAESSAQRKLILYILRGSQPLENVKFVVEKNQRILAMYEGRVDGGCTLDQLMLEILEYVREATPFVRLLKNYVRV